MAKAKYIEIRCTHCGHWFKSPFNFDSGAFDAVEMSGCRAQCPQCGELSDGNKENMRAVFEDRSGFKGSETT